MQFVKLSIIGFRLVLATAILLPGTFCYSQKNDSLAQILNFRGSVSVTNNGFSLIPTFTLGRPAVIAILNVNRGRRFSFEPEFRYALDFKPWSFVFIWRYKLVQNEKFQLILGTHLPALNFVTANVIKNGAPVNIIQARRFFPVAEFSPRYVFSPNIRASLFYLYGGGFEKDLVKHSNFVNFGLHFQNIPISPKLFLQFNPQFYYLQMDQNDGIYTAASLSIQRQKFPLSVSVLMNKKIHSGIQSKDFDWNIGLNYIFEQKFKRL